MSQVAATNIDAGSWREAAGPIQLELTVLDWFRQWLGYPDEAAGVLVSPYGPRRLRAVTHLDVTRADVVGAARIIRETLR